MSSRFPSEGLKLLLKQAQHDKVAAYNAALLLEKEHCGPLTAQQYYTRSAFLGYTPAMLVLSGLYMTGSYQQMGQDDDNPYPVRDTKLAVGWLRTAAKAGDPTATYALARCYLEGLEVEQNTANCTYYLSQIPFPADGPNPYELSEAVIFGSISPELRKYAQKAAKSAAVSCK